MSLNSAPNPVPRRPFPLAIFVVAIVLAAGVSVTVTAVYYNLKPSASGSGNVTVIDDLGRSVSVPYNPARVVVLGPSIVDSLVRLGLRDRIQGVDCSSSAYGGLLGDYTPAQVAAWNLSASMCVTAYPALSLVQILNFTPQIVFAASIVSVSTMEGFQATYGIPVVFLAPSTLGGIVYDVNLISQVFSTGATGARLVGQLQRTLAEAGSFVSNLSLNGTPLRSVLLTYYVTPASSPYAGYSTFGPGSFGQSLIDSAGGVNIAGASSAGAYPTLSGSQVLAANPSVIVAGYGFGVTNASYAQGPDWSSFPAVQHGNVTYVDVTLMTEADPTLVLWIPTFAEILYPTIPFV